MNRQTIIISDLFVPGPLVFWEFLRHLQFYHVLYVGNPDLDRDRGDPTDYNILFGNKTRKEATPTYAATQFSFLFFSDSFLFWTRCLPEYY